MARLLTPREILDVLVAFPSVSRDSNLPVIDWVEDYLAGHGISGTRLPDVTGTKANFYAHVGPEVDGGVMLSGHTDVVPVDGQPWSTDPFTVTERDGRLYGRGCCDMKAFDALAIWTLVEAKRQGVTRPLQLALSFDEEVGCTGCVPMVQKVARDLPRAGAVIVGEPTMMKVVSGHKGASSLDVHVKGHEVHSSILHRGVSAILEGARLVHWCNDVNAENAAKPPSELAAPFDPPYTSLHVGRVRGGTAANITAADCWFDISYRVVPDESTDMWEARIRAKAAEIEADMREVAPAAAIRLTRGAAYPGLAPEPEGEAEALVRRLTGDNAHRVVSYGTEAGHFQQAGYSVVICGPGDIAQAHQPDEYLSLAQFREGAAFMQRLLTHLQAG